jgi:outer membrane protein assembly factor BamB
MYQQDAQHTGRSPFAGPRQANVLRRFNMSSPENLPPNSAAQRADVQNSTAVGPDGTIYASSFAGVLFALRDSSSASDQLEEVWRFYQPSASPRHGTPALSQDASTLYLAFASGGFQGPSAATLYALKTATGDTLWSLDLGATAAMSSPTIGPDGTIYQGTGTAGQLFAFGADGKVRWMAQTGPSLKSAPALGQDGTVYQPSSDGKMYALSPQGQVKWSFEFAAHLGPTPPLPTPTPAPGGGSGPFNNSLGSGASPTVGQDGTIYIGANNSNLYAVAPDGSIKWLFEAEREVAGIWTTPALSPDGATIFFGANKGGVYAVKTADGSRRWQFPVYGSIYASSVLDTRGVLYTGTTVEHLYALDSASGEPVWDIDIHNQVWSAPSIRPDGTLAIADRGGVVQVIG